MVHCGSVLIKILIKGSIFILPRLVFSKAVYFGLLVHFHAEQRICLAKYCWLSCIDYICLECSWAFLFLPNLINNSIIYWIPFNVHKLDYLCQVLFFDLSCGPIVELGRNFVHPFTSHPTSFQNAVIGWKMKPLWMVLAEIATSSLHGLGSQPSGILRLFFVFRSPGISF